MPTPKKRRAKPGQKADCYTGWLGVLECLELCSPTEVISLECAGCSGPLPGMQVRRFLDSEARRSVKGCRKCPTVRFRLKYMTMLEGAHLFALNSSHLRALYLYVQSDAHDLAAVPDRFRRLTDRLPKWFLSERNRPRTLMQLAKLDPQILA